MPSQTSIILKAGTLTCRRPWSTPSCRSQSSGRAWPQSPPSRCPPPDSGRSGFEGHDQDTGDASTNGMADPAAALGYRAYRRAAFECTRFGSEPTFSSAAMCLLLHRAPTLRGRSTQSFVLCVMAPQLQGATCACQDCLPCSALRSTGRMHMHLTACVHLRMQQGGCAGCCRHAWQPAAGGEVHTSRWHSMIGSCRHWQRQQQLTFRRRPCGTWWPERL